MPTKTEKDSVTGRETTGHEWDGLRELNTPLPKWWLYVFFVTVVVGFAQMLLLPSVPFGTTYFHGLLGYSQRKAVDTAVAGVAAQRAVYMDKIAALPLDQIRNDPQLLAVAETAGRITFADNCQPCHGPGGEGRVGYPALGDDVWLWGGTPADIQQTVTHGIRADDADTRQSQMPRFGADGILKPEQVQQVADYVMTLYGKGAAGMDVAPGKQIFAENCAVCHGDAGQGNQQVGAPPLASHVHLYGDTRAAVVAQIANPRMGVMPAWGARFNPATIKSLVLYVHGLGGGQ